MRHGTCVKCGAATVRAANNGIELGEGFKARLRPHLEPEFRGMIKRQEAELWTFGCVTCGYIEFYVLDAPGLAFMGERWIPVPPTHPPVQT